MKKIKQALKEMFCHHNYEYTYMVKINRDVYERYPKQENVCTKCGKVIWVGFDSDLYVSEWGKHRDLWN